MDSVGQRSRPIGFRFERVPTWEKNSMWKVKGPSLRATTLSFASRSERCLRLKRRFIAERRFRRDLPDCRMSASGRVAANLRVDQKNSRCRLFGKLAAGQMSQTRLLRPKPGYWGGWQPDPLLDIGWPAAMTCLLQRSFHDPSIHKRRHFGGW